LILLSHGKRSAYVAIGLIVAAHGLNHTYSTMVPILYPAIQREFNLTYAQVGLLATGYSLALGLPQFAVGILRNKVRGKVLLGFGMFWQSFMNIMAGFAGSFSQLVGLRTLAGLGASPQHPVGSSMIADRSDKDRLGRMMGTNITGANLGTVIAPPLATLLLMTYGWRSTLMAFAVPGLLLGAIIPMLIYEKSPPNATTDNAVSRKSLNAFRNRQLLFVTLIETVVSLRFGVFGFIPTYFVDGRGMATAEASNLYTILLVGSVIGPFLWGSLSDRLGKRETMTIIMAISTVLVLALPTVTNMMPLMAVLFLLGLTFQSVSPITQSMVARLTDEQTRSLVYGVYFTISFGIGSIGPWIFGYITDTWGFFLAFVYVAIVTIIAALCAIRIPRENQT